MSGRHQSAAAVSDSPGAHLFRRMMRRRRARDVRRAITHLGRSPQHPAAVLIDEDAALALLGGWEPWREPGASTAQNPFDATFFALHEHYVLQRVGRMMQRVGWQRRSRTRHNGASRPRNPMGAGQ